MENNKAIKIEHIWSDMKVIKIEHIYNNANDRWIYLEYNEQNKICGMNFMQGDEYEEFKVNWSVNDPGLMEFYTEMLYAFDCKNCQPKNN